MHGDIAYGPFPHGGRLEYTCAVARELSTVSFVRLFRLYFSFFFFLNFLDLLN